MYIYIYVVIYLNNLYNPINLNICIYTHRIGQGSGDLHKILELITKAAGPLITSLASQPNHQGLLPVHVLMTAVARVYTHTHTLTHQHISIPFLFLSNYPYIMTLITLLTLCSRDIHTYDTPPHR